MEKFEAAIRGAGFAGWRMIHTSRRASLRMARKRGNVEDSRVLLGIVANLTFLLTAVAAEDCGTESTAPILGDPRHMRQALPHQASDTT